MGIPFLLSLKTMILKKAFGRGLIDKQNLVSSYKFTLNKGDIDRLDYFFTRYSVT